LPDALFSFRQRAELIILETQAIAEKFGIRFRVDIERRIEGAMPALDAVLALVVQRAKIAGLAA
jgi:hypothetical protein